MFAILAAGLSYCYYVQNLDSAEPISAKAASDVLSYELDVGQGIVTNFTQNSIYAGEAIEIEPKMRET